MKMIEAIINPFKLDEVEEVLPLSPNAGRSAEKVILRARTGGTRFACTRHRFCTRARGM